jgi:hypothetical protein
MMPNLDPKAINARLYNQVSELLAQLENNGDITIRERIAALMAIGRLQTIFLALRLKDKQDDPNAGTTVRKYATAFKAHDTSRRKAAARANAAAEAADITGDDLLSLTEDDNDDAESA